MGGIGAAGARISLPRAVGATADSSVPRQDYGATEPTRSARAGRVQGVQMRAGSVPRDGATNYRLG